MKKLAATLGGAALLAASAANASFVTFGDGGATLQGVLDGITVGGPSSVNVVTDQHQPDELWAVTGAGGSVGTFIIELAGNANINTFGVYDATDSSKKVQLFSGPQGAGDQVVLSIKADGSVFVNFVDSGIDFAGNQFGYYLGGAGNTFYSEDALNGDLDGDGEADDHMAAYQGTGDTVQLPGLAAGTWTDNEYVLAWEDLPFSGSDKDFADLVLMVESVESVSEPAMLAVLGLGLLGFAARRRKA